MRVTADEESGAFSVDSPHVPGPPVRVTALVEAHLPTTDVRRATDPLLASLLSAGAAGPTSSPTRGTQATRPAVWT
ncbi:hypothetical protein ACFQ2B_04940 [Streptomyces stramineus]